MSDLYVGLMSGTSVDGIDAALVDFSKPTPTVLASYYSPYPASLREQILALCRPGTNEIHRLGELDIALANAFADTTITLLKQAQISANNVTAIGSHGQTIRHSPDPKQRYTLQIGDPNTIAARTGITTVADFRRKDIALGGQGAPLVPAFHHYLFANAAIDRAIVNVGGIANVTLISKKTEAPIIGFDTGPGNALMDEWINQHQHKRHDEAGAWAASGKINQPLLSMMLSDPYFSLSAPKSTGRELFNLEWLRTHLNTLTVEISTADIQATLAELTAMTILDAIKMKMTAGEIYLCGGGAHNTHLLSRITALAAPHFSVNTTEQLGIHPDWVEAIAFAWLAHQTVNKRAGNLPSVTGAKQPSILGGLYYA